MGFFNTNKNNKFGSDISAVQRSEILDECTCNFCLSMDGRVFSPDDPLAQNDLFCPKCRGVWVEILKNEINPPQITGVPDRIRNGFKSGEFFVDLKEPIVEADSPAYQFLNKSK